MSSTQPKLKDKRVQLNQRLYNADQSWHYEAIWEMSFPGERPNKLRVKIRRNAYNTQSGASVAIFSGVTKKWEQLATLDYPEMQVCRKNGERERISYVQDVLSTDQKDLFTADESELLRQAALILGQ